MARKQTNAAKPATEVLVVIDKDAKGVNEINASLANVVFPAELNAANDVQGNLCLNLLAGTTHAEIVTAHAAHGGIKKLFPRLSNADRNALKVCLDSTPAKMQAAWTAHVGKVKRLHGITLQAVSKAVKAADKDPNDTEAKITLKEELAAWLSHRGNKKEVDALPLSLVMLLEKYNLMETGDAPDDEPEVKPAPEPKQRAKRATAQKTN